MTPAVRAVRLIWQSHWRLMRRYHRFEVRHLERIEAAGAALIVGYHGRPLAHDLCMLQSLLYERQGRMPHAFIHRAFARVAPGRWLIQAGEFLTHDSPELAQRLADGAQLIVTPGGTREGYRSFLSRYRVDWEERLGYLRLALKYRLPLIPTAATGVDHAYLGLNNGQRWGQKLHLPHQLPFWLGLGPLGLFPFSPPYPVRIVLHIGEPILLEREGPIQAQDRARLLALHHKVSAAVQALLDHALAEQKAFAPRLFRTAQPLHAPLRARKPNHV